MESGTLDLDQGERDRLVVLRKARDKKITQRKLIHDPKTEAA